MLMERCDHDSSCHCHSNFKMIIILAGDHGGESAGDYFDRVMKETGTIVLWPSKLKIGAKSKKDPQVKVIGFPDAVEKAKELICKDLDTKVMCVCFRVCVRALCIVCCIIYICRACVCITMPTCLINVVDLCAYVLMRNHFSPIG